MTAAIEASGLGKRYGRRRALADCTLTVPAGRVTGLVGPNGAGKTTLLQLAAGLLDPTSGEIRVLGDRPAGGPAQLARVGFVAQDGYLSLASGSPAAPPGAWVISASQLTTPDGRSSSSEPAGPCGPQAGSRACNAYVESLHLRQTVTYQPASRYWAFQWIETAIYLAFALILAGLCLLRIRPGRSAAAAIRRPRVIRPASALGRSQ